MNEYGEAQKLVTPAQAASLTCYYWWALPIPLVPELFFGPRLRRRNHVIDRHQPLTSTVLSANGAGSREEGSH